MLRADKIFHKGYDLRKAWFFGIAAAALLSGCGGGGGSSSNTPSTSGSYFTYTDSVTARASLSLSAIPKVPNSTTKLLFGAVEAQNCNIVSTTGLPTGEVDATVAQNIDFTVVFASPCSADRIGIRTKETKYVSPDGNTTVPIIKESYYYLQNKTVGSATPPAYTLTASTVTFDPYGGRQLLVVDLGKPVSGETVTLTENSTYGTMAFPQVKQSVNGTAVFEVSVPENQSGLARTFVYGVTAGGSATVFNVTQAAKSQPVGAGYVLTSMIGPSFAIDTNSSGNIRIPIKVSMNSGTTALVPAGGVTVKWTMPYLSAPWDFGASYEGQAVTDANGNMFVQMPINSNTTGRVKNFTLVVYIGSAYINITITQAA